MLWYYFYQDDEKPHVVVFFVFMSLQHLTVFYFILHLFNFIHFTTEITESAERKIIKFVNTIISIYLFSL